MRILNADTAQDTILRRHPFSEAEIPEAWRHQWREMFGRSMTADEVVGEIIQDVRQRGDAALAVWEARLDGCVPDTFVLHADALAEAHAGLAPALASALRLAADRIRQFHRKQPCLSWIHNSGEGTVGQVIRAIERVGLYCPGGSAPLPSTLLMTVIPAQVAEVPTIAVVTPPLRATGRPDDVILAAAHVAGLDRVHVAGGAQAIAALAFGTESIPRVDKICGPGGLFTTLAKRQLYGFVGIDGLPGPTETLIIADAAADAEVVAADLMAQAEHDVLASAILLTPSRALAEKVRGAFLHQMETMPRADIIAGSLARNSGIVITESIPQAVDLANAYAPEHLCLMVENPWDFLDGIRNAGGVFLGHHSFEVLGDYVAGPSHVMPTNGTARFGSALNVMDFVRIVSLFGLNQATAERVGPAAARLAEAEGLTAHARAVTARWETE